MFRVKCPLFHCLRPKAGNLVSNVVFSGSNILRVYCISMQYTATFSVLAIGLTSPLMLAPQLFPVSMQIHGQTAFILLLNIPYLFALIANSRGIVILVRVKTETSPVSFIWSCLYILSHFMKLTLPVYCNGLYSTCVSVTSVHLPQPSARELRSCLKLIRG